MRSGAHPHAAFTLFLTLCAVATAVRAQDETLSGADVLALLAERDALIIELQHTIRALRERVDVVERLLLTDPTVEPAEPSTSGTSEPIPAIESSPPSNEEDQTGLAIDETAAERALERTLVQTGALLLPRGSIEFVPTVSYALTETDFPVTTMVGTGVVLGSTTLERSASFFDLTARFGLPGSSQLELGIPYLSVTEVGELSAPGVPTSRSERTGRGAGDFRIGLAKTLIRENGRWPDLVGRLSWHSGEGDESDNGVLLGGGFEAWSGSLSFVKRRDPLALFLSLGYTASRERDGVEPGNQMNVSFGTAFAMSPASSLFGSINYRSIAATRIDEQALDGSSFTAMVLNLGLTTILRRGTLLNIFTEIGLNEDAPDYSLAFSLPMRW
ncbi:MAG: hypothetical protein HKN84_11990 [Gammaproteobacteria bacterium]|nr:hypothetical protein [Gammaproteobacteria bacterium]